MFLNQYLFQQSPLSLNYLLNRFREFTVLYLQKKSSVLFFKIRQLVYRKSTILRFSSILFVKSNAYHYLNSKIKNLNNFDELPMVEVIAAVPTLEKGVPEKNPTKVIQLRTLFSNQDQQK